MKSKKHSFLYVLSIFTLILTFQNCAGNKAQFSANTLAKTAALEDHLSASNDSTYEIVHDQGDGAGQADASEVFVNMEGGDVATVEDDPESPDGNSIEPNQPTSNPLTPDTTVLNSDGSLNLPLDCNSPDNLYKECIDEPVVIPDPPIVYNTPLPKNITFDIQRWCRGRKDKGNVLNSDVVNVSIKSKTGEVLCQESDATLVDEIVKDKKLTVKNCDIGSLKDTDLIYIYNQLNLSLYHGDDKESFAPFEGTTKSKVVHSQNTKADAVSVSIGNYKKYGFLPLLIKDNHKKSKNNIVAECDEYDGSPLAIDMRAYSLLNQPFYLSDPKNGKMFNILGQNSLPSPNRKMKISWPTDNRIMFLVLPKNGKVNGIDELFGDSTKGPDGFNADNGFKALAKYDAYSFSSKKVNVAKRDGKIDFFDEVFMRLRLWYDKNLNAVVDEGELIPLPTAGVKSIDLSYNPKFHVRDQYGNHIKFKSVIEMTDGNMRPIFDIWFKLDENIQ